MVMNPLNPQEAHFLAVLTQRAQANRQMPPHGQMATMNPPDNGTRYFNGIPFRQTEVFEPMPWLAVDPNIGYMTNDRVSNLTGGAANTEVIVRNGFDVPSVVYALTGSAIDTTGADLPVGMSPLDTFLVQFVLTNGQRWQTVPALGSTLLGSGERPRKTGRPTWVLNNGAVMEVRITPLRTNLRIDVVMYTLEQPGPTNIATG